MSQDQNDITVFLLPFDMDNYGAVTMHSLRSTLPPSRLVVTNMSYVGQWGQSTPAPIV